MGTRRGASVAALVALVALVALAACTDDAEVTAPVSEDCTWSMAGADLARSHTTGCSEAVDASTVDRLAPVWFHETPAEVTGAPVVDDDALYFGDWSGVLRSLGREDGSVRWEVELPTSPHVYAGQITASPVLAEVAGEDAVVAASGNTVVAVRSSDGGEIWSVGLADPADPDDPTEIQGAPIVAEDLVLVPTDVHNSPDWRSGLVALSLEDGSRRWTWDPEEGAPSGGCGSVWGSPAVSVDERLVVVGTGNCVRADSWTGASEAIVGVDLDSGELRWTYQPHEAGNDNDWDFAGAPNLYEIDGRPVAGLGNKDGWYYVVDRTDGELVWSTEAQRQQETGTGFSFGGFIGALALADGVLVGGTAVGDCPCQHAFDAATGELIWQDEAPTGTYAAAGGVSSPEGSLVFQAGIDQTLRAWSPRDGELRWEAVLPAITASGPAIAGAEVYIGVGFREPGSTSPPGGGVQAFRVLAEGEEPPTPSTTTIPEGGPVTALMATDQECVGAPCDLRFTLKDPPSGTDPSITVEITPDPFRLELTASGLGDPEEWLAGPTEGGATVFAALLSPRDDRPELASVLCTFDSDGGCTADRIEIPAEQWNRLSVVVLADADTAPTLQEGYTRLVTTRTFDPALRAAGSGADPILFSGQGNHLDGYPLTEGAAGPGVRVVSANDDDPDGWDLNGQICTWTGDDGTNYLLAGEDTGQPEIPAGWGIFSVEGDDVEGLTLTREAKLTPTFQPVDAEPENYGCAVLPDGRILTTDVGEQVEGDSGQLIIWFPPFDGTDEGDIAYCKLDVSLPTAQSILVTSDEPGAEEVLVAASRAGILRFRGPLPTADTPEGGCGGTDATGRPLAEDVEREILVAPGQDGMATPAGLAPIGDGGFYASSVFTGVINAYDADGTFRSTVLAPADGDALDDTPYATGTPLGLAVDPWGNLYYADIGLVISERGVGPGRGTGTLRVVRFTDGTPNAPEVLGEGLAFPDGLGVWVP